MGSIISTGVGSGLDVTGLVQKLIEAEGAPKTLRLNAAEAKVQAKLSALGTLRSALAGMRDAVAKLEDIEKFRGRDVSLSSTKFLSASASSSAIPGSYAIEVVALASAQKIQSQTPRVADAAVGTGTLTITTASLTFDVAITAPDNTLADIASAINDSPAGEHVGAAVVNADDGAYLVLTARTPGADGEVSLSTADGDAGLIAFVADLAEQVPGGDAEILVDGLSVTSSTNTFAGAIEGLTVNLTAENEPGETTTVTIGYDRDGARAAIDTLVGSYNAVLKAIKNSASYNADTRQGGPLFGDAGVRNLGFQLRRELTSAVAGLEGSFTTLNDLGITAELDGTLVVDSERLGAAFDTDFAAVGELFAAPETGLANKLDRLLDPYLQFGGVFDSRNASLKSSITDIGEQREALNVRLLAMQDRYLRQFNALDGLLAQLQTTSNFLNQQLSQLPGAALLNKD